MTQKNGIVQFYNRKKMDVRPPKTFKKNETKFTL